MNQLEKISQRLSALFQKSLVKDSIWMLGSQGLSIFIQATYFILVARALDAASYGAFISVTAISSIAFPFVGLGSGNILVKNVSQSKRPFEEQWGNTLVVCLLTGIPLSVLILAGSSFLFADDLSLFAIALLLIADLIGLRILEISSSAFIAISQVKRAAQLKILYNLSKLVAAIILIVFFKKL